MNHLIILLNHSQGFDRLTKRKFTKQSKVHGKKIRNEKIINNYELLIDSK
jgi:hypothetical protein